MSPVLHASAAGLLTLLHIVLALGVSMHVLLYKREPATAIGWVGLAWLAPVLGSLLYLLLGINRVRRRARILRAARAVPSAALVPAAHPRTDYLAALELTGQRITQRCVEHHNAIEILSNGDEGYPSMLAALDAARRSVALASYIFRADQSGSDFIDALVRARARGVAVRVLIDGFGGGYIRAEAWERLRAAGVPAARFLHSPLPWRMPFLNLRNHKKLLVVDGAVGFLGGLNIGDENRTGERPAEPVFDTHFRVEGPVVAQLIEVFVDDWRFATGESLTGDVWAAPAGSGKSRGDATARVVTSGPDEDLHKIEYLVIEAIGCARSQVRIMTPYFLPDERLITALTLAAFRGVAVDIVLPKHSNHPTVDWAAQAALEPLLTAGCCIWERPAPFHHSKLMTIDERWSLIGSSNWDTRSFRLNFELDLEIYDVVLARRIDALMRPPECRPLALERLQARELPVRLRDGAARLLLPYL
jgi:cardiolipin synthase